MFELVRQPEHERAAGKSLPSPNKGLSAASEKCSLGLNPTGRSHQGDSNGQGQSVEVKFRSCCSCCSCGRSWSAASPYSRWFAPAYESPTRDAAVLDQYCRRRDPVFAFRPWEQRPARKIEQNSWETNSLQAAHEHPCQALLRPPRTGAVRALREPSLLPPHSSPPAPACRDARLRLRFVTRGMTKACRCSSRHFMSADFSSFPTPQTVLV